MNDSNIIFGVILPFITSLLGIIPKIFNYFNSTKLVLGDSSFESDSKKQLQITYGVLQIITFLICISFYVVSSLVFNISPKSQNSIIISGVIYIEGFIILAYFLLRTSKRVRDKIEQKQKMISLISQIIILLGILLYLVLISYNIFLNRNSEVNKFVFSLTALASAFFSFIFLVCFIAYDIERKPINKILLLEESTNIIELKTLHTTKEFYICTNLENKRILINKNNNFKIDIIFKEIEGSIKNSILFLSLMDLYLLPFVLTA